LKRNLVEVGRAAGFFFGDPQHFLRWVKANGGGDRSRSAKQGKELIAGARRSI
jgi:hypothetical protein